MIVLIAKPLRDIGLSTFADITASVVTDVRWTDAGLAITFVTDLTALEAVNVRIRARSADAATETLLRAAYTAYQNNVAFLAIVAPTTAQVLAQVSALTRQMQGVLRTIAPLD